MSIQDGFRPLPDPEYLPDPKGGAGWSLLFLLLVVALLIIIQRLRKPPSPMTWEEKWNQAKVGIETQPGIAFVQLYELGEWKAKEGNQPQLGRELYAAVRFGNYKPTVKEVHEFVRWIEEIAM